MKKLLLLYFIVLICANVKAQEEKDVAQYVAKYHYKVSADPQNPSYPYREDMMLLIGKTSSLFKSYDGYKRDSLVLAQQTLNMKVFSAPRPYTDDEILTVYNDSKGYLSKKIGLRYYWETEMPRYNWKILSEKTVIAGYNCQKAEMFSPKTNKNYIAWFTAEIPVPTGPAYINGLPGLIVKFEDNTKTVEMELYSFQKVSNGNEAVSFGNKAIKTTKVDFDRALQVYQKDPMGFMKNTGAIGGKIESVTTGNN
ncbi:GLPGLI family protein [Mucilaginibacter sp.]